MAGHALIEGRRRQDEACVVQPRQRLSKTRWDTHSTLLIDAVNELTAKHEGLPIGTEQHFAPLSPTSWAERRGPGSRLSTEGGPMGPGR